MFSRTLASKNTCTTQLCKASKEKSTWYLPNIIHQKSLNKKTSLQTLCMHRYRPEPSKSSWKSSPFSGWGHFELEQAAWLWMDLRCSLLYPDSCMSDYLSQDTATRSLYEGKHVLVLGTRKFSKHVQTYEYLRSNLALQHYLFLLCSGNFPCRKVIYYLLIIFYFYCCSCTIDAWWSN